MAESTTISFDLRMIGSGTLRLLLAVMLAGCLLSVVATFSAAEADGGDQMSVDDMLRGAYSPIATEPEIAVTEVQAPMSIADMLRGTLSPVASEPEIAVTEVQTQETAADMIRGDLSPI